MIIFNFDVLALPGKEFGARVPYPEGMRLWSDLFETHMGRLAVVIDEAPQSHILEHWLKINGIKAAVYEELGTTDPQMKAEKVYKLSMAVGTKDWYIDTDPRTVAITMKLGMPSLLVANPYIVRPEWVDPQHNRPWDELVEEIDRQATMRAARDWGEG